MLMRHHHIENRSVFDSFDDSKGFWCFRVRWMDLWISPCVCVSQSMCADTTSSRDRLEIAAVCSATKPKKSFRPFLSFVVVFLAAVWRLRSLKLPIADGRTDG
jgi:hypothetical protein